MIKVTLSDYPVLQVTLKPNGLYNLDLLTPNKRFRLASNASQSEADMIANELIALEVITRKGNEK